MRYIERPAFPLRRGLGVTLALGLALSLPLAGCSSDDDDDDATTQPPTSPTPVVTETPATQTPGITETPASTETPAVTETPEPSETPSVTGTPEPSETPGPTDTPVSPTPEPPRIYPSIGVFTDAPVSGLAYTCEQLTGTTGAAGEFEYFEGETIAFSLGGVVIGESWGQHTVTLHDLLPGKDYLDPEVVNLARLLQSLDRDGDPGDGIDLSPEVTALVEAAALALGIDAFDFADDGELQALIDAVYLDAATLAGHTLQEVGADDARENLLAGMLEADVWRQNVSRTPSLASRKPKLDIMTVYVAGRTATGEPTGDRVKPIVVTYSDGVAGTGASDIFVSVSLDQARTWKRFNVSQTAARTSFTLDDGTAFPGDAVRPQLRVDNNLIFATWPSKYCPSANPGGLTTGADRYGVVGPQGSVDYGLMYDRPDLGQVPFSCIWAARGWVDDNGVHWLKTEQVSSGLRDAIQNAVAGTPAVGFAHTWQEDPLGLKPGHSGSIGPGGTGASVNHGTDIWYSYIPWADFTKTDSSYDPTDDPSAQYDDGVPRMKPLSRFSSPVRVTDNAPCKYEEGELIEGDAYCQEVCATVIDESRCMTVDGRWLHGSTGAARANLQMVGQQKTAGDGSIIRTATVLLAYEENQGSDDGEEPTPDPTPDPGSGDEENKIVVYHNFATFDAPETIAAGTRVSEAGMSARRVRFVAQGSAAVGASDTRVVLIYREGPLNAGCVADIMLRRAVGGYSAAHFQAPLNLSSPTVTATEITPYGPKATGWTWSEADLLKGSSHNTFDDARGLRAQLRGDFLVVGYAWTANVEMSLIAEDHYDYHVRRSFDGGATWTDAGGAYQPPQNLSNLPNHDYNVIEPRLVFTPATIKNPDGSSTGNPEDVQNPQTYFVAYGTSFNTDCEETGEEGEDDKYPADLFYSRTNDRGETYDTIGWTHPVTGTVTPVWDWLSQGDEGQSEAQLKMTPDGSKLWMAWSQTMASESAPQHDIWLRLVDYTP